MRFLAYTFIVLSSLWAGGARAQSSTAGWRAVASPTAVNLVLVNPDKMTPTQAASGGWIDYTIQFQNTGIQAVKNVTIVDSLPVSQVQISTFQIISFSHSNRISTPQNNNGILSITFSNINLTTNGPNSFGFVRFRVKVQTTLEQGDEIWNQLWVKFDNEPSFALNHVSTLITNVTGADARPVPELAVGVWPNPASVNALLTVQAQLPLAGPVHLRLRDATGRLVREQVTEGRSGLWQDALPLTGTAAGFYLLDVQASGMSWRRRIVVE